MATGKSGYKNCHKGKFKPKNPKKYMGDPKGIVYRSGYEFKFFMKMDHDPNVMRWASEEFCIRYYSPVDKRERRYFPDVYYETRNGKKYLVEIKPYSQCIAPKKTKNTKRFLREQKTYITNQSKWAYAQEWCDKNNVKFVVVNTC